MVDQLVACHLPKATLLPLGPFDPEEFEIIATPRTNAASASSEKPPEKPPDKPPQEAPAAPEQPTAPSLYLDGSQSLNWLKTDCSFPWTHTHLIAYFLF